MIPAPPFQNLDLGPLTLHMYGLLIGIGVIAAVNICERNLRLQQLATTRLTRIVIPAVVIGFIGARLYHVLSKPAYYLDHPADIPAIWHGGLGVYGGVAAGALTAGLLARRYGLPASGLFDAAAPGIALAQAIGRWGNYFNQELFGRPTDLPWALEVNREHRPEQYAGDDTFHPTFLYESLWNLVVFGTLMVLLRRWHGRARGVIFALYAALYSAGRFFVEGLRSDPSHEWLGLRQNQWVALVVFIAAVLVAVWLQRRHANRT